ncbi:MAG TPA: PAS-domain containing protein [Casimicrobiaceae bacterium]|nr:PAS-domain containing protein [Casimicrobiaceae bacterium]
MTKNRPRAVPDHCSLPHFADANVVNYQRADADEQLLLVLDNMPGAFVYTDDDLRIVVCNDRFKEMYIVPHELL